MAGGAPEGNQNGVKIKDPDLRQKAYQLYCDWLSKGKTKKSFTFVEGNLMCTWGTIESYVKENPVEFDPKKIEIAYSQGYAKWEAIADGTAEGSNKKACVPALNMVLRNKFKWDTAQHLEEKSEDVKADLNRLCDGLAKGREQHVGAQQEDRSSSQASEAPN